MEGFNNPYIDKLIGISNEQKELAQKWHEYIITNIETMGGKKIEGFEIEKTEKDVALIEFTQMALNRILEQYKRTKQINIPLVNIHVLPPEGTERYTNGRLLYGAHSSLQQSVLIDRDVSDIQFSLALFHELLHIKSYTAFQIISENKDNQSGQQLKPYRNGFRIVSRDGKRVYLQSIEEAVISYLTASFYESIKDELLFRDEKLNNRGIIISRSYEVSMMNDAIDIIYENNKGTFLNRQEVLKLFIDAQINGNLLKLGKLIEQTFGSGTLKKIDASTIS
ncbi:hypothetical protein [Mucilaginibacter sp.]|uniref:hypothetical protein n=1 Tax=Mucilaginibacter sp. TaxID=1882438 RepID=UPI0025CEE2D5|nr:hypothetical protein [Mucilaginibacter sp.]